MNKVILSQMLITALGGLLCAHFIAPLQATSFVVGSLTILLSFFLFGWGFGMIFQKKLIALAVVVIVFKYAILGIIIFKLVKALWFSPLWFSIGIASFVLSALIYAIVEAFLAGSKEGKEDGSRTSSV
jgi:hypothetical protein